MNLVEYKKLTYEYKITKETKLISNFLLADCTLDLTDKYINKNSRKKRCLMQDRYIVVGGDTLKSIADDFNLTIEQIKYINKIEDIYPGLVLLIPNKEDIKLIYSIPTAPILDEEPYKLDETYEIKDKMISLTFDDGPSEYTNMILDLLDQYKSKATFYIPGKQIKENDYIIKKIIRRGHQIGNHGYTHKRFTEMSLYNVRNEIFATNQELFKLGLDYPKTIRPPYCDINEEIKCDLNLPCILYNIDSKDLVNRNIKSIKNNVLNNIEEGSIVLLHDLHKETYQALCSIIPELLRQGYKLVTVDELYKYNNILLEKGKVYKRVIK